MTETISFRPTDEDRAAIAELGATPTEAIHHALRVAHRILEDEQLRVEAATLSASEAETRHSAASVQANPLLQGTTVIVAPTSSSAQPASWRPMTEFGDTETLVLTDKIAAADVGRLGELAGFLVASDMDAIDTALRTVLRL